MEGQFIATLNPASAESALNMCGCAAMPARYSQSAIESNVSAQPGTAIVPLESRSRTYFDTLRGLQGTVVKAPAKVRAGESNPGRDSEEKPGRLHRDFEGWQRFLVAGQVIRFEKTRWAMGPASLNP